MTAPRNLAIVGAVVAASLAPGCSQGDAPETNPEAVLAHLADEVIVPSYESLAFALEDLGASVDALCDDPSTTSLTRAQQHWRNATIAWQQTRAAGVGPAMDRRLTAAIGFEARPDSIEDLLDGDQPLDEGTVEAAGAATQGISAIEIALFGDGSDALASPDGARRCQYLSATTALAVEAAQEVVTDWTEGYRDTFVEGVDGDPMSSVSALVNEVSFRVTEVDDQGLRALVEAERPDGLPENRSDGPASFHLAELRGTLADAASVIGDGSDGPRLVQLVADESEDTAQRLEEAVAAATDAVEALPDSVTDAFDDPAALAEAQAAVMDLKVLLATEVASELGVTIGFSDSDGDS